MEIQKKTKIKLTALLFYLILFNISLTNWFNCCWYVLILFVNIHSRYPRYPRYMTQWKSKKKTKIKLTALLFYLILFNISLTNWFNCVWYGCVNIHSPPPRTGSHLQREAKSQDWWEHAHLEELRLFLKKEMQEGRFRPGFKDGL